MGKGRRGGGENRERELGVRGEKESGREGERGNERWMGGETAYLQA